jgi:DNA-binding transcriptional MocR family regulator
MLVLNSPHNPTGGVIPEEDMRAIAEMVRERDLIVLSDEIYSRIYYEDAPVSIAAYPGSAGEDHYSGRILEDLCDDGMAHGLRGDAGCGWWKRWTS